MRLAYFDCFAGASGDMILGALLHAGLDPSALTERLRGLNLPGWSLEIKAVLKNGIAATAVNIHVEPGCPSRNLADIEALIASSDVPSADKALSVSIFQRLARAEAKVHGCSPSETHFHEVGAVDAIVDVVGAACAVSLLGIESVQVSPLPLGTGFTRGAHGLLPLPAPAVVELLSGVPVTGIAMPGETVTPTGAAILTTLASAFGPIPVMRLDRAGYGAGQRDAEYPNVLRVLIGDADVTPTIESLVLIETNIDDMSPQIYESLFARLFDVGALDVWLAPVYMKKNRPGTILAALCREQDQDTISQVIFAESTTLGLRRQPVQRVSLPREMLVVETRYGTARVKAALADGKVLRVMPEYEDCRRLADSTGVPLRDILAEVEQVARSAFLGQPGH